MEMVVEVYKSRVERFRLGILRKILIIYAFLL